MNFIQILIPQCLVAGVEINLLIAADPQGQSRIDFHHLLECIHNTGSAFAKKITAEHDTGGLPLEPDQVVRDFPDGRINHSHLIQKSLVFYFTVIMQRISAGMAPKDKLFKIIPEEKGNHIPFSQLPGYRYPQKIEGQGFLEIGNGIYPVLSRGHRTQDGLYQVMAA